MITQFARFIIRAWDATMKGCLASSSLWKIEVFSLSSLSAAAVHAGVLRADPRGGKVVFLRLSLMTDQGFCRGLLNHGIPQLAAGFPGQN